MLRTAAAFVAVVAALASGCPGPAGALCGQSTELPGVASGRGTATRSDGVAFDEAGTWKPNATVTIGTLDMVIANDDTGLLVADLIANGSFPICVPQGARSEQSGQANFVEGGFVTDAEHDGGVAILAKEAGDVLVGRFGFDLVNTSGETLGFTDGEFRLPQRP